VTPVEVVTDRAATCPIVLQKLAPAVIAGHAFVQKPAARAYELAAEEPVNRRVAVAFDELAWRPEFGRSPGSACLGPPREAGADSWDQGMREGVGAFHPLQAQTPKVG
jgi:hypothetical protein